MRFFKVGTAAVVTALYATSASAADTKLSLKHSLLGYMSTSQDTDPDKTTDTRLSTLGGEWGFEVNNGDCTLYMDFGADHGSAIKYGHMVTPEVEVLVGLGIDQTTHKVGDVDSKTNSSVFSLGGTYYLTLDDASYMDFGLELVSGSQKEPGEADDAGVVGDDVKTTSMDIGVAANYNMKIWDRVEYSAGLAITSTSEKVGEGDAVKGMDMELTLASFKYTL